MNTRRAPGRTAQPQSTAPCRPTFTVMRRGCVDPLVMSGREPGVVRRPRRGDDAHACPTGRAAPTTRAPPPPSAARRRRAVGRSSHCATTVRPRGTAIRTAAPGATVTGRPVAHDQPHRTRRAVGELEVGPEQQDDAGPGRGDQHQHQDQAEQRDPRPAGGGRRAEPARIGERHQRTGRKVLTGERSRFARVSRPGADARAGEGERRGRHPEDDRAGRRSICAAATSNRPVARLVSRTRTPLPDAERVVAQPKRIAGRDGAAAVGGVAAAQDRHPETPACAVHHHRREAGLPVRARRDDLAQFARARPR